MKVKFITSIIVIYIFYFFSCKDNNSSLFDNDFQVVKLYKITFYESYLVTGGLGFTSEFIFINNSDNCVENIKDPNILNFMPQNLKFKLKLFEYCSKGTFDINTQVAPGDTAFYQLTYSYKGENNPSFSTVLQNYKLYLDLFNKRKKMDSNIQLGVHPLLKIYYSIDFPQKDKEDLPFHEKLEFGDLHSDKTAYEFLRYKYETFYNK